MLAAVNARFFGVVVAQIVKVNSAFQREHVCYGGERTECHQRTTDETGREPRHNIRDVRACRRGTRGSRDPAYDEGRPCSGRSQIRCDELLDPSATSRASTSPPGRSSGSIASRSTTAITPACRAQSTRPARVSMESRSRCPTGRNTTRSRSIRTLIAGSASASLSRHTISPALRRPHPLAPSCTLVGDGHVTGSNRPVDDSVRERRLLVVHEFRALARPGGSAPECEHRTSLHRPPQSRPIGTFVARKRDEATLGLGIRAPGSAAAPFVDRALVGAPLSLCRQG